VQRRIVTCASVILVVAAALKPARAQVSLGTVIALAQRNSSTVRLAEADLDKADAVLRQTKDVYIPSFVIGSNVGPPSIGFTFGSPSIASATMQSLVYSTGQSQYIKAARVGIEAATLGLKDAKEQVALDASTYFLELDTVRQELEAAHQQSEFSQRLIAIEQQRTDAGVDPLSALLQARLTAAQLRLVELHLETRAATDRAQLAALTGLPGSTIVPDHASIPAIPAIKADEAQPVNFGIQSSQSEAQSKSLQAKGDDMATRVRPLIGFGAQYNRDATSLNNYNLYFGKNGQKFKADNFSAGFSIQIPIWDFSKRSKSRETAAEALRAKVEAEQAQRQNDVQIATLDASIRELDAMAEIASLKQQISAEQLKAVQSQLQYGNGAGSEPGATPQLSPKAEQLARIDESQKTIDSLDTAYDLDKARLGLLRALGHISEWLDELQIREPAAPAQ
jgi:outer membrane protein TolC